jgi:hypothetical protein
MEAITVALHKLAQEKDTQITSIAMAYVMHKYPWVFPIVGGRKIEHLKSNIEALGLTLTDEEIDEIENVTDFKIGFPMNMLFEFGGGKYNSRMTFADMDLLRPAGKYSAVEKARAPKPVEG